VKLHAAGPTTLNTISGYGDGYVLVNGQRYETNLIVLPEKLIPWDVKGFDDLSAEDFVFLKSLNVEIVLLGTGARQRFPHPSLTAPLAQARIGLEVMDVQAACRTYNILVSEERRVAAALLLA
jgi:uncharacterized protein